MTWRNISTKGSSLDICDDFDGFVHPKNAKIILAVRDSKKGEDELSYDEKIAHRLWETSEELTGAKYG